MPVLSGQYIRFPVYDNDSRFIEYAYRPHIQFRFKVNHNFTRPIAALIDSGADRNLFPAEVGESIGIKIKKGRKLTTNGIGEQPITVYRHFDIELFFDQGKHFRADIDFSYEMSILLLGGKGFFDKFKKVTFEKKKGDNKT